MLPRDDYAFVGDPDLLRPPADEVHISCVFTWDKLEAERLFKAWSQYYGKVLIGGPAFGSPKTEFVPGKYIMPGVTFTSYGCNHQCPWCLVRMREGPLAEEKSIIPGHIIQDNSFMQCSRRHIESVFEMLRYLDQAVTFSGGLESAQIMDWFVEELRSVKIAQLFLACDTREAIKPLRRATQLLGLPRDKVRSYVLVKFKQDETLDEAEGRCRDVWEAGAMPFVQLFQPDDRWIEYPREWREFQRAWSRPAIMKSVMSKELVRT